MANCIDSLTKDRIPPCSVPATHKTNFRLHFYSFSWWFATKTSHLSCLFCSLYKHLGWIQCTCKFYAGRALWDTCYLTWVETRSRISPLTFVTCLFCLNHLRFKKKCRGSNWKPRVSMACVLWLWHFCLLIKERNIVFPCTCTNAVAEVHPYAWPAPGTLAAVLLHCHSGKERPSSLEPHIFPARSITSGASSSFQVAK